MVSKTEHTNGPLLAKLVSQFYCSCHTFPPSALSRNTERGYAWRSYLNKVMQVPSTL